MGTVFHSKFNFVYARVTFFLHFRPEEAFILLRISYLWYTVIGVLIVITLGTLVSLLTNAFNCVTSPSQRSTKQLNDIVNPKDAPNDQVNND